MRSQKRFQVSSAAIAASFIVMLAACSQSQPELTADAEPLAMIEPSEEKAPEEPDPEESGPGEPGPEESTPQEAEPEPAAIEDFDFANAQWLVMDSTEAYPLLPVTIVEGKGEHEWIEFTVNTDEILYSDANSDGVMDALVPIDAWGGGNTVDRQWYIWAALDGEVVQVELPVARSVHCGNYTESITAADGGFQIHEFRRTLGDRHLSCVDYGSDERVRTVGFTELGSDGELWPIQIEPFPAFGGLCPVPINLETPNFGGQAYQVPYIGDGEIEAPQDDYLHHWELQEWPLYSMMLPNWSLIGLGTTAGEGCAWVYNH